jgi:hypothetical protein
VTEALDNNRPIPTVKVVGFSVKGLEGLGEVIEAEHNPSRPRPTRAPRATRARVDDEVIEVENNPSRPRATKARRRI